jgi:IMP dehydrogenase/GMP reductase
MGLIQDKIYYTYNDVTIMPCVVSDVEHRSECNPFDENNHLPLFTAPMDTVVNSKNFELFEANNIYAILPRTEPLEVRIIAALQDKWTAFSLDEFESIFCNKNEKLYEGKAMKVLIDVANGHMKKIFDIARRAKDIWGDKLILMGGNIANPETYEHYAKSGFSFVRCGIGGGRACITSTQTSIHTPLASLIHDIAEVKKKLLFLRDDNENYVYEEEDLPKIIADGGIRNYSDIIKALALGADYVMIGSVFTKMLESAAPKRSDILGEVTDEMIMSDDIKYINGQWTLGDDGLGDIYATFYGMASREGQIALNGSKTKTSEGLKTNLKVEYTMTGWCRNFVDYLRSAMSYVGTKYLDFFSVRAIVIINSPNAVNAVNK